MNLPFSFVINLYRQKCDAERKGDMSAIQNLENRDPELFSGDFDEFIEMVKDTATYLGQNMRWILPLI